MFEVNIGTKEVKKLEIVNFSELQVQEKFDIEVWIRDNPTILKESLLIISEQTVLPSGRLPDLIALDKSGDIVIIELKRDDSGKEVYWQAITYAAQFSEYSFNNVIELYESYLKKLGKDNSNAKELIEDFIEEDLEKINQQQKIILVSKEFHQDVLKAALWLLDFGVEIKVLKLTPYKYEDNFILLDSEVIIPTPGVEDYIKNKIMAEKGSARALTESSYFNKGNFDDDGLKSRLKDTFERDSPLTPRLLCFVEILLSEDRVFDREEIKDIFYNERSIGNNLGHAGRLLSNVSQFLTKRATSHLRQIIEFEMDREVSGEVKDNFKIVPEYRNLVEEVIIEIQTKNK